VTEAALKEKNQEKAAVAKQRSSIYGLLATAFRQEPSGDFLRQVKEPGFRSVLEDMGVQWPEEFLERPEEETLDELSVEYARLFLGPGRHISPHESVHYQPEGGGTAQLWGKATVQVKKFVESAGFRYTPEYKGLPDHISVELEFMGQVIARESQAWEEGDEEKASYCLDMERKFLEQHLSRWIPDFCDRVSDETESPFYELWAGLTKQFILFEMKQMDGLCPTAMK